MPLAMRILKWGAVAVALLLASLFATAVFVVATLDLDAFKPRLVEHVRDLTGRELTLEGPVDWRLWPRPGLSVGTSRLGNPSGFDAGPFAELAAARFDLAWLPLLRREIRIDRLVLDEIAIHLERRADGHDNWSDLLRAASPTAPRSGSDGAPASAGFMLRLRDVDLRDGRVAFVDHSNGVRVEADSLRVRAGSVGYRETRPATAELTLRAGESSARVWFDGDMTHNPRLQRVVVGGRLSAEVGLRRQGLELSSNLTARISGVPRDGQIQFSNVVADNRLKTPGLRGDGVKVTQRGDFNLDLKRQTLDATALNTAVGKLSLAGQLRIARWSDELELSGVFNSNTFDLRTALLEIGVDVPARRDPTTLGRTEFGFELSGDRRALSFAPLSLRLDGHRLHGSLRLPELGRPLVRFELAGERLDLDRYLSPPSTGTTAVPADSASAGPASAHPEPRLDLAGDLTFAEVRAHGLGLSDVALTARVRDGVLRIEPFTARAYQGRVRLAVTRDARGPRPEYVGELELNGVRTEEMLTVLIGEPLVASTADVKARLNASGTGGEALARSLGGVIEARLGEGTIQGPRIARKIDEIRAFWHELGGQGALRDPLGDRIRFTSLTASGTLVQGVLDNRDLQLRAPRFQARGEGSVDLPGRRLDYTLAFAQPERDDKQGGFIPLGISGSFAEPRFSLKLEDALKARAQEALDQHEQALREELDQQRQIIEQRLEQQGQQQREALQRQLEDKGDELKQKLEDKLGDTLRGLLR